MRSVDVGAAVAVMCAAAQCRCCMCYQCIGYGPASDVTIVYYLGCYGCCMFCLKLLLHMSLLSWCICCCILLVWLLHLLLLLFTVNVPLPLCVQLPIDAVVACARDVAIMCAVCSQRALLYLLLPLVLVLLHSLLLLHVLLPVHYS